MRSVFLSKSPEERLKKMRQFLESCGTRAAKLNAPFTVLVYGSASYGLKKSKYGHLDDIDLFLVIPRGSSVEEILRIARQVFQTDFDVESGHVAELLHGNWEMCRMYGESPEGIKLGFRLLCQDTFDFLSTKEGSISTVRNVAKIGQSRIVVDVEWSVKQWKYISIGLENALINQGSHDLLLVNHHVFSDNREQLGALGRKLLTCKVLYDPSKKAKEIIRSIWRLYIQMCVESRSNVSSGDIINSVMRADKFSEAFRKRLLRLVNQIRK